MKRRHLTAWLAVALCAVGAIAVAARGGTSEGKAPPTALQREKAKIRRTLDRLTAAGLPGRSCLCATATRPFG